MEENQQQKSRLVAGLLQIFLGTFGVGRFYLGYTGIGIAQLVVSLLTCGVGALWPFIDGILIIAGQVETDAMGQPLREQSNEQQKSRLAAGLLQIFLGSFGVGRFYLGYTGIGIAQLVVSLLTCGIGAIWPFIDGILIIVGQVETDAMGQPLRD